MADLSATKAAYRRRAARAVREAAPDLRGNLREAAPSATGRMASVIRADPKGATTVEVVVPVDYASYTRPPGTRPHEIRAVAARALRFFWPRAGGYVFFKSVQHPGYQPSSDWYGDEIDQWRDLVEQRLRTIPL